MANEERHTAGTDASELMVHETVTAVRQGDVSASKSEEVAVGSSDFAFHEVSILLLLEIVMLTGSCCVV